jgi:hypothetical protein
MTDKKYNSFLYKSEKAFHKMTMRELCDHSKIVSELDKLSYEKIQRIEKWSREKRDKKIKKFLNKRGDAKTRQKRLKKSTRKTKKLKLNRKYFTLHLIE